MLLYQACGLGTCPVIGFLKVDSSYPLDETPPLSPNDRRSILTILVPLTHMKHFAAFVHFFVYNACRWVLACRS